MFKENEPGQESLQPLVVLLPGIDTMLQHQLQVFDSVKKQALLFIMMKGRQILNMHFPEIP